MSFSFVSPFFSIPYSTSEKFEVALPSPKTDHPPSAGETPCAKIIAQSVNHHHPPLHHLLDEQVEW